MTEPGKLPLVIVDLEGRVLREVDVNDPRVHMCEVFNQHCDDMRMQIPEPANVPR